MYHKWQSCDVWFLRYEAWQTEFIVILGHFLPFYHTNNPKNPNFEKMKKTAGDIIILHLCTTKYDAWFLRCGAQQTEFFVTLGYFFPFIPSPPPTLKAQEIKIKKKWKKKKCLETSSCYTSVPRIMIRCYAVLEIWHVMDKNFYFPFWAIFALLPL